MVLVFEFFEPLCQMWIIFSIVKPTAANGGSKYVFVVNIYLYLLII